MRYRTMDNDDIRVQPHRWNKIELRGALFVLWQMRNTRSIVLAYNVRTHRMLAALRREFDRNGWTLRAVTQMGSNDVAISIRMKYRGNRPGRV